MLNAVHS